MTTTTKLRSRLDAASGAVHDAATAMTRATLAQEAIRTRLDAAVADLDSIDLDGLDATDRHAAQAVESALDRLAVVQEMLS